MFDTCKVLVIIAGLFPLNRIIFIFSKQYLMVVRITCIFDVTSLIKRPVHKCNFGRKHIFWNVHQLDFMKKKELKSIRNSFYFPTKSSETPFLFFWRYICVTIFTLISAESKLRNQLFVPPTDVMFTNTIYKTTKNECGKYKKLYSLREVSSNKPFVVKLSWKTEILTWITENNFIIILTRTTISALKLLLFSWVSINWGGIPCFMFTTNVTLVTVLNWDHLNSRSKSKFIYNANFQPWRFLSLRWTV